MYTEMASTPPCCRLALMKKTKATIIKGHTHLFLTHVPKMVKVIQGHI